MDPGTDIPDQNSSSGASGGANAPAPTTTTAAGAAGAGNAAPATAPAPTTTPVSTATTTPAATTTGQPPATTDPGGGVRGNWFGRVYHGVLNALGGTQDTQISRDPVTGQMKVTTVPKSPGSQWKQIVAGALSGLSAGGGQIGPGAGSRSVALGVGGGIKAAQQGQQRQRENANEDFEAQEKAAMQSAQTAHLAQETAKTAWEISWAKHQAIDGQAQQEYEWDNRIQQGGEGSRDVGIYPTFQDFVKAAQQDPSLHTAQANGLLYHTTHINENGQIDGIHVYQVTPDWKGDKNDAPVTIRRLVPGEKVGDPPKFQNFTVPAGGSTNGALFDLQTKEDNATLKAIDDWNKTQADLTKAGNEARKTGSEITKNNAEAGLASARAGQIQGGGTGEPGGQALTAWPAPVQNSVRGLTDYSVNPASFPTRTSAKAGQMDRETAIGLAKEIDPSYDEKQFANRSKLQQSFTSGKARQSINSLNQAVGHLGTLQQAATALNNQDFQTFNSVGNWLSKKSGNPAVTNFENAATAVQNELAAVFKGTGASDQEIKEWRENLNSSESPRQLAGAISTALDLMRTRLDVISDQYSGGMGKPRAFHILTPEARQTLQKLGGLDLIQTDQGGADAPSPAVAAPAAGGGQGLVSVTAPDGSVHSFPDQASADNFKHLAGIK